MYEVYIPFLGVIFSKQSYEACVAYIARKGIKLLGDDSNGAGLRAVIRPV
jgi:hypothetical protein